MMELTGLMCCRNDGWVLGLSLRVALLWCDSVVLLLHACTDRSESIGMRCMVEYPGRVHILYESGQQWDEMVHRQAMLEGARARGATHLAIIDADEVLTGDILQVLADPTPGPRAFRELIAGGLMLNPGSILELPGYNLRDPQAASHLAPVERPHGEGLSHYHSNGVWGNRWFSTAFADDPALSWTGDTFHHREPHGKKLQPYRPIQQGQGGTLHLWGSSERRLRAKHALYKITEHLRKMRSDAEIDWEYSLAMKGTDRPGLRAAYGTPATWTYSPVPESWWAPYAHLMKYLDVDAEPWQERECQRLVALHGREKFAGLDLFGVA